MANSLKSQLFEIYNKKGLKKYSPQCTYINYTLKRCIKKTMSGFYSVQKCTYQKS